MRKPLAQLGAALFCVALVAAACGDDNPESGATPATAEGTQATTAEGAAGSAGATAGQLAGMKGTTPLVELSGDFKSRLDASWEAGGNAPLEGYNYAAETYDAVVIIALAVEAAKSDGIAFASEINDITKDGTKCEDFASCKKIIAEGGNPDYDGKSGPLEFAGNGEPLQASYGVLQFGPDNRLDDAKTTYKQAAAPASADVPQQDATGTRAGDGVLKIGTILPQTGNLAYLGPPEFAAFGLAIADVNEAGGVLGQPVQGIEGDSGDATTDTVNQTTDRLLAENVDAIIGAASSGVSLKVIDKITGAGVVHFSPANTSKTLSTYNDKGLYFRTAPSDILQGQVLAEVIAEDGNRNIAIINRNDSYGVGLTEDLTAALEESGASVVLTKTYDEKADRFNAEVNEIKGASPDAVVVIGFEESSKILSAMVEAGIGPQQMAVYGVDGNMSSALGVSFDKGE
jgi:ABC-type branched-subunit amino acid transport system substrate-binding protein